MCNMVFARFLDIKNNFMLLWSRLTVNFPFYCKVMLVFGLFVEIKISQKKEVVWSVEQICFYFCFFHFIFQQLLHDHS